MIAAAERLGGLRLEQVVEQRRAGRPEQHDIGELPQVRRLGHDAQAGSLRRRRAACRSATGTAAAPPTIAPDCDASARTSDGAGELERGQHGSSAGAPSVAPTRSASSALSSPPSVPMPAIWPKRRLAVRGSNRSLDTSQNPEASSGPAQEMCR